MEIPDIGFHDLRRVARGVDGDEDRLDLVAFAAELIERRRHDLEFGRTDIRAIGEAEEDEHVFAAEVAVADPLAGLVGEREGAAHRRGADAAGPAAARKP